MPKIIAAEEFHTAPPEDRKMSPMLRSSHHYSPTILNGKLSHEMPKEIDKETIVRVHVSAGRWCISCPWCNSGEYASRTDRRFLCSQCLNAGTGVLVAVWWPPDWRKIEQVLELRPNPANANWHEPEELLDLVAENEAFGIPTYDRLDIARPEAVQG